MSDSAPSAPDWVVALAARARTVDGSPPFSDQALVDLRLGTRELVAIGTDAAALVALPEALERIPRALEGFEAEFVVDPDARRRGIGTAMLEGLLTRGVTVFWAHGEHPGARALAASYRLRAIRELLHFVGSVRPGSLGSSGIEHFLPGRDEEEWVALNSWTFAGHPDQGSVTRADLEQLEAEHWFRADNFLVLRRDGRMIGYCWLKVDAGLGEFYVVGVAPDHHGEHLGSLLFDAGLARLAELGIRDAHLYVEADNEQALRLYRARGFSQDSVDIQYAL